MTAGVLARAVVALGASSALWLTVKATAILALALAAVRLLAKSRASVRHAIVMFAFLALAVLPCAATVMPSLNVAMSSVCALPPSAVFSRADQAPNVGAVANQPVLQTEPRARRVPSIADALWIVWACGVVLSLAPLIPALRRAARLRRDGRPWDRGSALMRACVRPNACAKVPDVRVHRDVTVPQTAGIVRAAILFPEDALDWSDEDLYRVFVHELEHVRRRDWIVQCGARVVAALYWFHPLAWIAYRRLGLEAERACDDAVLAVADRAAYAEQLVKLAQRLSAASARLVVSMARCGDLSARVRALLDVRQRRGRISGSCAALITLAALGAVSLVSPVNVACTSAGSTAPADRLAFAAASIRRTTFFDPAFANRPDERMAETAGGSCASLGETSLSDVCEWAMGMTLRELVTVAFASSQFRPPPLIVGPDWTSTARFDVVGRAPGLGDLPVAERRTRAAMMMRTLLEDRFRLRVHHEMRQAPIDRLVSLHAGGPRGLERVADATREMGSGYIRGEMTMGQLAGRLSNPLNRIVRDETGSRGTSAIDLPWRADDDAGAATERDPVAAISRALNQELGLALEAATGDVDALVIDRATPVE